MPNAAINSVAIVVKPRNAEAWQTACELSEWLEKRGVTMVGSPYADDLKSKTENGDPTPAESDRFDADLIIVLGGDGTMISTARLIGDRQVLVLGINYGSLGYLTEFRIEEMFPALETILAGEYEIDSRVMLRVGHFRNDELLAGGRVLNDVVINKAALARIIEIDVTLNGQFVNSFRSDGLIVATPTGSTAYAFSVRGPIIDPTHRAILLTPISPHMLFDRSLVLRPETRLRFEVQGPRPASLSVDGHTIGVLGDNDAVSCTASPRVARLVTFGARDFLAVLKAKFGLNDR